MAGKNKSNEIHLVRQYDAPLKMVWDAWTDPDKAAIWWGPRGFTITTHSKDFRTGGTWDYTMHGPDGTDYANTTKYLEVEPYKKLVYDHGGHADRPALFRVTVLFSEAKGGTKMDMTVVLPTPEAAEETRKIIKKAGGDSTWDRLAEYLEKESTGKEKFVINRAFDAPIELLYEMWTNPKNFTKWLAPAGFEMEFIKVDIRAGGSGHFKMFNGEGFAVYGKVEYLELKKPDRIVYAQQFADEKGGTTRHPMSPTWPETMLTTVVLSAETPNRTRVTVSWEPRGAITGEELATFIKERGGMTQGWTGSFDKLEEIIAAVSK